MTESQREKFAASIAALNKMPAREANQIQLMAGDLMSKLNIKYDDAIVLLHEISSVVVAYDIRR